MIKLLHPDLLRGVQLIRSLHSSAINENGEELWNEIDNNIQNRGLFCNIKFSLS